MINQSPTVSHAKVASRPAKTRQWVYRRAVVMGIISGHLELQRLKNCEQIDDDSAYIRYWHLGNWRFPGELGKCAPRAVIVP